MLEDMDGYDRGVFLDRLSADEKELLEKIREAENGFYEHSFRKELTFIRSELMEENSVSDN